jgi:hypothetical protein
LRKLWQFVATLILQTKERHLFHTQNKVREVT